VIIVRLLLLAPIGFFITDVCSLVGGRGSNGKDGLTLVVPAIALAWLLRLRVTLRADASRGAVTGASPRRLVDATLLAITVAGGLAVGYLVEGPGIAAGQASAGFGALSMAAFLGAALCPARTSLAFVILGALGQSWIVRWAPTEAPQGGVLLLLMWTGTRLVTTEIRRAGRDADQAMAAAGAAEHEDASARVHDGLALLRLTADGSRSGPSLAEAVEATHRSTRSWIDASSPALALADWIASSVTDFPDLPLKVELTGLHAVADPSVGRAAARATHTVLANVRAHAHASRVTVTGDDEGDGWRVTITDNGRGFDCDAIVRKRGLTRFTRDALEPVGVVMHLVSVPGEGTTVTLRCAGEPVGVQAAPEQTVRVGRFAGWRTRPVEGRPRAQMVMDVAIGGMLFVLWSIVLMTVGMVARIERYPTLALVLVVVVPSAWTLVWLTQPPWRDRGYLLTGLTGCCAGMVLTWLAGAHATSSGNLGVNMATWSGNLLAATIPRRRYLAASLVLPQLALIAHVSLTSALVIAAWTALYPFVTGALAIALTVFGDQSDKARDRIAELERKTASDLLKRQLAAMEGATRTLAPDRLTDGGTADDVDVILQESEAYLRRPRSDSLLRAALHNRFASQPTGSVVLDLSGLDADLSPATTHLITEVTSRVVDALGERSSGGGLRVRANGDADGWSVSILDDSSPLLPAPSPASLVGHDLSAELAAAGIEVDVRPFPGGGLHIALGPDYRCAPEQPADR
jgi:hypothetical protein